MRGRTVVPVRPCGPGVNAARGKIAVLAFMSHPMNNNTALLVPVILSGGAGTRLWPLSRESAPKPFMPLPDGDTLLGKTVRRALGLPGFTALVIGPGGTKRIYGLFTLAFGVYSVVWSVAWFGLRGTLAAEVAGAVLGSAAMAGVMAWGFGAWREVLRAAAVLVLLNALGYFLGEVWWRWLPGEGGAQWLGSLFNRPQRAMLAMLGWGACFGAFFGAGVGHVIFQCQHEVRARLRTGIPLKTGG